MKNNMNKKLWAWTVAVGGSLLLFAPSQVLGGGMYHSRSSSSEGSTGMHEAMMRVNLNTASAEQIATVPGIDSELAQAIVDYRDSNGPLYWVDQLLNVRGFDKDRLEAVRDHVTVW